MTTSMKKLIIYIAAAVVLIAVLLIILFACGGKNNVKDPKDSSSNSSSDTSLPTPGTSTSKPESSESEKPSEEPSDTEEPTTPTESDTTKPEQPTDSESESDTKREEPTESETQPKPTQPTASDTTAPDPFDDGTLTKCNDTLYIKLHNVRARSHSVVNTTTEREVLHYGESYQRIGYNSEWSYIIVGDYVRYVLNSGISTTKPSEPDTSDSSSETTPAPSQEFEPCDVVYYVTYKITALNVRSSPSLVDDKNVIGWLAPGGSIRAIATNGRWIKVVYGDKIGYVGMTYLSITPPTKPTESQKPAESETEREHHTIPETEKFTGGK